MRRSNRRGCNLLRPSLLERIHLVDGYVNAKQSFFDVGKVEWGCDTVKTAASPSPSTGGEPLSPQLSPSLRDFSVMG